MKITGICHSCFTKVTLEHRPRIGLCVVCPNCDAILESLQFASNEDWSFEDGDDYEEKIFFSVQGKEMPR